MEVWREIPGTDGMYWVSNQGNVKSRYKYSDKHSRKTGIREIVLKQHKNSQGYYRVPVRINGEKKRCFVHRLVAEAFLEKVDGMNIVNHKDFNPTNNTVENLEWTTDYGNYRYSFDRGRFDRTEEWRKHLKIALDKRMGKAVVGVNMKTGERVFYSVLNDCAKDGFTASSVSQCCNGKRNQHAGYVWRFAKPEEREV